MTQSKSDQELADAVVAARDAFNAAAREAAAAGLHVTSLTMVIEALEHPQHPQLLTTILKPIGGDVPP